MLQSITLTLTNNDNGTVNFELSYYESIIRHSRFTVRTVQKIFDCSFLSLGCFRSKFRSVLPSYLFFFFSKPRDESLHPSSLIHPEARHALTEAVFHMSKMRAQVAADARVTSGALYL